jgi:hypothetical protein
MFLVLKSDIFYTGKQTFIVKITALRAVQSVCQGYDDMFRFSYDHDIDACFQDFLIVERRVQASRYQVKIFNPSEFRYGLKRRVSGSRQKRYPNDIRPERLYERFYVMRSGMCVMDFYVMTVPLQDRPYQSQT